MHGCGGVQPGNEQWVTDLTKWGYVTLLVNSFGPRGLTEICTNFRRLGVTDRTFDAYGALEYLQTRPFVDKERVALMGWSHVRCDVFKNHSMVELKVYRSAPHSFDNPGLPRSYLGHSLGYDRAATPPRTVGIR